jgi:hypothetical protein
MIHDLKIDPKRFLSEIKLQFNFLLNEAFFSGPTVNFSDQGVSVSYTGKNTAIIFSYNWSNRDSDLGCYVSKIINGKSCEFFDRDLNGNLLYNHLSGYLLMRGYRAFVIPPSPRMDVLDRMLSLYKKQLLSPQAQLLLEDREEAFDMPEKI